MRTHTNNFKTNIKNLGRQCNVRVAYGNTTLQNEQINSATLHYNGDILKSVMKTLELDSNIDIPLNTQITFQFGLLVGSGYEYINYGTFIVNKSEKQENTNSYLLTCYDKMLYSMIPYESLGVIYPITIRNYISAICTKLGLQFQNTSDNFVNYNKEIPNELYLDLGYTFRDVLDELAQVTASTICINDSGKLEVRYITNTNDTIDEEFLKNVNVNFGEQYGAINTITFSRSADSDNISKSIPTNLPDDDKIEIKISDNQILNGNNRDEFIDGILNKLYGLSYYINDFASTGITYYDLCDRYNVKVGNTTYSCVMLNDEININNGVVENIHTEMPKTSKTDYTKTDKTDRKLNQTYLIVDKQQGQINAVVSQVDEIEQDLSNPTNTLTGQYFDIDNALDEPLVDFKMYGDTQQTQTTQGKNLFDENEARINSNYTASLSGNYKGYLIQLKPNTQYTIQKIVEEEFNSDGGYNLQFINYLDGSVIFYLNNRSMLGYVTTSNKTFTTDSSGRIYLASLYGNDTRLGAYFNLVKVQIEEGSQVTSYEPFIPNSPSPDYPQDIHLVSGDNTIEICGKNLLDEIWESGQISSTTGENVAGSNVRRTKNFIPIQPNTTYTLSRSNVENTIPLRYYDNQKNFVGSATGLNGNKRVSFTSPSNAYYVRLVDWANGSTNVQLEIGDITNPIYEPYTGETYTLSLGSIELLKIGNYKDYIHRQDNRWYLHKETGKVVYNGSESWLVDGNFYYNMTYGGILGKGTPYCNYAIYNSNKNSIDALNEFVMTKSGANYVEFSKYTFSSASDFKTWLSTHNTIVYYVLATSTDTEITGTLLEQLNRLMTLPLYKNMTHITIEPNDLTPIMNIEYVRDTAINSQFVRQPQLNNYYTRTETTAQINISNSSIKSDVAEIQTTLDNNGDTITRLSSKVQNLQTSTSTQINTINQTLDNGVEKVTNSLVKIDINGINTSKDNETFNTQITNKTFEVKDGTNRMGFMGFDEEKQKMMVEFPEMQTQKLTNAYHTTEKITEDGLKWSADFYVGDDN